MTFRPTALALAALACASAHADDGFGLKFSGFGTVGAVYSSERQADFVTSAYQAKGAGFSQATSLNPDSKLAGQVNATLTDKLSAVVQVIVKNQYDNSYTPNIEWANIKYQLTPELNVRVGRIALPSYMVSESRLIGYANPMVRPPVEVYGMNPNTGSDGVDLSWRTTVAGFNNTLQVYYGGTKPKSPGGNVKIENNIGFSDTLESGALSMRVGYSRGKTSLYLTGVEALLGGYNQFAAGVGAVPVPAYQAAAAQASAIAQKYNLVGNTGQVFGLGVNYDPGDWFVAAELAISKLSTELFPKQTAWYVNGGYRFGKFTPYVSYASTKATAAPSEPGISTAGLDPQSAAAAAALDAGLAATFIGTRATQNTVSLGLRWDFMGNLALKTQFDRISLGDNSAGRLANVQPGFAYGGKVNLVSVALDFVF